MLYFRLFSSVYVAIQSRSLPSFLVTICSRRSELHLQQLLQNEHLRDTFVSVHFKALTSSKFHLQVLYYQHLQSALVTILSKELITSLESALTNLPVVKSFGMH